jgi:hypothetical protein
MGVRLSELTGEAIQTNLFEDTGKKTQLYKAIDEVKGRYGTGAVVKAGGQKAERARSRETRTNVKGPNEEERGEAAPTKFSTSRFIRKSGKEGEG